MIVQKHILNSLNNFYMGTIKELYYNEEFMDYSMEKLISTYEIYGKKVDYYLSFIKNNGSFDYKIGAFYFLKQVNKKYKILITLKIFDGFCEKHFSEMHIRMKSCIVHEIEHHLQKLKAPGRAILPRKNFKGIIEYINAPSEIEACTKHLYYMYKKTGISFSKLLIEEAEIVSDDEDLQSLFMDNITKYILKRKDLNLFKNITF